MARTPLILDRYELLGTAGSGGFGTVQIAWDPRIQRKVAIKTIQLTEHDAFRAGLPGAKAVAKTGESALGPEPEPEPEPEEEAPFAESDTTPEAASAPEPATRFSQSNKEVQDSFAFSTADRWRGVQPWGEFLKEDDERKKAQAQTGVESEDGPEEEEEPKPVAEVAAEAETASTPESDSGPVLSNDSIPFIEAHPKIDPHSIPTVKSAPVIDPDSIPAIRKSPSLDPRAIPTLEPDPVFDDAPEKEPEPEVEPEPQPEPQPELGPEPEPELEPGPEPESQQEPEINPPTSVLQEPASQSQYEPAPDRGTPQVTALAHLPGLDEARTAAKLSDSRIVAVYDFEVRDQTAYLIMEYVEGITLTELLYDYPEYLTLDIAACVFDAVAGALVVAHKAGVLHLDIKPDNIIINSDGQAKVTDFGLATLADASGKGTTGGGTIGYMPPEQMRREHLDARTDEWSLAAVTYEMLTGDNPFRVPTLAEAEGAILNAELVLPSLCWEQIDDQIDDVIFYALDPDREQRYDTIKDFAEEIDKFLGNAKNGRKQLALVVQDALDDIHEREQAAESGGMVAPDAAAMGDMPEADDQVMRPKGGWLTGLFSGIGGVRRTPAPAEAEEGEAVYDRQSDYDYYPDENGYDNYADYEDDYDDRPERGRRRERKERGPFTSLSARLPEGVAGILGRVFGAAGSGFIAYLALANVELLHSYFGGSELFIIGAVAIVAAAAGAVKPAFGSLISLCLLGAAIVLCGHPLVGGVLVVVTALWFYIVGREGDANANVILLTPLSGAVGGSSAVPLFAGASLELIEALITTVFALVVAAVFAAFGSGSLLGWDVFTHWNFMRVDITRNMGNLLMLPTTWTTAAGWLGAALGLSMLRASKARWGYLLGLGVAVAAVCIGSLIFATPQPQLFVSLAIAVVILAIAQDK